MKELYEYRRELIDVSLAVVQELRQILVSFPTSSLYHSPDPGISSPHRCLAHLRDVQVQALSKRLKQILTKENPSFTLFDDEAWLERHYRQEEPWQDILEEFARAQVQILADLDPRDADIWNRNAEHPWFGMRTFQWWVELCLEYAQEHLGQIQSALQSAPDK